MKKMGICFLSAFLMFLLSSAGFASEMANVDFARMLVTQLNLDSQLPANYDTLPASEQFSIAANVLSSVGITAFVEKNYDQLVSSGDAAQVVYKLVTVPAPDMALTEKINYLVKKGIMPAGIEPEVNFTTEWVDSVFSNADVVNNLSKGIQTYVPSKEDLLDKDAPTGIKLEAILVDPDIVKPYTQRASPTI